MNETKTEEATTERGTLTVPNPSEFINIGLYFIGHLNNNMGLQSQPKFFVPLITSTDELAKMFASLISQPPKIAKPVLTVGGTSDPSQDENTPMDIGEPKQTPCTSDTAPPTEEKTKASKPHGDSDVEMDPADVSALNVHHIREKERLQDADHIKYQGPTKFSPKSFKSGSSVGYISVKDSSFELLFAQVKMSMNKVLNILPLSRFNHLLENSGSKVWSKRTAQSVVLWKQKMTCPMDGPSMPGGNCPIKVWSNKKMLVAQWQIYHIDQYISRIVYKHIRNNVLCHYMTDRETDMKQHISKVHAEKLKSMIDSNLYVHENAWLYLTFS